MFGRIWQYLRAVVEAFVADDALSRGALISVYAVTSIGPVLFIVVAIAGLVFGENAARGAVSEQLSALMGKEEADLVQRAVQSASDRSTGIIASVIGVITLLITASGVFGEMQSALNMIWKAEPHGTTISRLIRARAASLGLVAALGFLFLVSLVVGALLSALAGLHRRAAAFRRSGIARAEFCDVVCAHFGHVRRYLQGTARRQVVLA
jgi:membrane protein